MSLARLQDVSDFILDGTHASPVRTETGVPVLSAQNVRAGELTFDTDRYTSEVEYRAFARRLSPQPGDVLLTIVGTIGRVAVLTQAPPFVFQRSVAVIRPSRRVLDPRFLYHAVQTCEFQAQLQRASNQSSQAGVYLGKLKDLLIPLPSLDEQRRIADVLDRSEALQAKRGKSVAQIEKLVDSTFVELFGDPRTNSKGWPTHTLGDVAAVQGGLQLSGARATLPLEVPYLRVANVHRARLELGEIKVLRVTEAELKRTLLQAGDMLVVEGHGNPGEIGRAALWDGSIAPCVHQNHLIRVRFDRTFVLPEFASAYVNSPGGRQHLLRAGKTTSGLNTISVSDVRGAPIAIPPRELQVRFAIFMAGLRTLRTGLLRSQSEMALLSHSLQTRAFAGQF